MFLGPHQYLGRTEGSRGEHDDLSGNVQIGRVELLPLQAHRPEMNEPSAVFPFDVANLRAGEYLGTVIHGVGQVIEQRRILGAHVTSRTAVAAQCTFGLHHIGPVAKVVIERHVDRRTFHRRAHCLGGSFQRL